MAVGVRQTVAYCFVRRLLAFARVCRPSVSFVQDRLRISRFLFIVPDRPLQLFLLSPHRRLLTYSHTQKKRNKMEQTYSAVIRYTPRSGIFRSLWNTFHGVRFVVYLLISQDLQYPFLFLSDYHPRRYEKIMNSNA